MTISVALIFRWLGCIKLLLVVNYFLAEYLGTSMHIESSAPHIGPMSIAVWCAWMGHVSLVAITGTTILVHYLLSQVTATYLKIGHP